jgi:hypothetical protein
MSLATTQHDKQGLDSRPAEPARALRTVLWRSASSTVAGRASLEFDRVDLVSRIAGTLRTAPTRLHCLLHTAPLLSRISVLLLLLILVRHAMARQRFRPLLKNLVSPPVAPEWASGRTASFVPRYKVVFVPFRSGRPSGDPVDVLTGFVAKTVRLMGDPSAWRSIDAALSSWRTTSATSSGASRRRAPAKPDVDRGWDYPHPFPLQPITPPRAGLPCSA